MTTKTPTLKQTKEYRLFLPDETNRTPNPRKLKKIYASMKQWGFLPAHPIACVPVGNKMIIRDGQHRFQAARELDIPVWYVCDKGYADMSIAELNGAIAGAWNPTDYIESYCNQGKVEYAKLRSFIQDFKIPPTLACSLLSGRQALSDGGAGDALKSGRFVARESEYAKRVASVVVEARAHKVGFSGHRNFIDAVSKAIKAGIPADTLCDKMRKAPELLRNAGTTDGFLEVLEELYNFRSRAPVPLRFMANESAKGRKVADNTKAA